MKDLLLESTVGDRWVPSYSQRLIWKYKALVHLPSICVETPGFFFLVQYMPLKLICMYLCCYCHRDTEVRKSRKPFHYNTLRRPSGNANDLHTAAMYHRYRYLSKLGGHEQMVCQNVTHAVQQYKILHPEQVLCGACLFGVDLWPWNLELSEMSRWPQWSTSSTAWCDSYAWGQAGWGTSSTLLQHASCAWFASSYD